MPVCGERLCFITAGNLRGGTVATATATYQDCTYELRDGVAIITLNRPERLNAISPVLVHELIDILERGYNDEDVRVLLITGAGRAFCAGADLQATAEDREHDVELDQRDGYRRMIQGPIGHWGVLYSMLGHYPKPIIAAVNGVSAGAGFSLALAADIRIASTEAKFISVFIRRGLVPDTGTSYHLPQLIGRGRAIEMLMTGDEVDAALADKWGLVNRVVEPDQLLPEALALATRLAQGPTVAIELTKRLVSDLTRTGLDVQLQNEAWAGTRLQYTEDAGEGRAAFLERRAPRWKGR
jgi:2-(1,2-epoxy-1,2-dihydrophenyl)acetyl-CoA isomerase